ncbi:polysaccharide deacetylase family protein [Streptomyces niveiscabiei]|uniref:polysaccharide deacetylase family protein n=1 Tax=Streptomyces niveiscabiei TaxID=164115 RepID=UPI0029BABA79|nr:polysaccharide deacetylase family protein [Streptomyces niveiscabiei]MDX3388298.1 polysaccharide deacetylase family protein [Streptomyces niveiscabiei]
MALSFDDGPSQHTPRLLDTLASHRTRATFFVVGQQVQARPQVVAREVAEGHAVGNHSWDHSRLNQLGDDEVLDQIDRTAQAVLAVAGVRPRLVRPPYGAFSTGIRSLGSPLVLWDVDSLDWQHKDRDLTVRTVLDKVAPGSVVLLHDLHPTTVDAVPALIEGLTARGYTLVTVPELFADLDLRPGRDYRRRANALASYVPASAPGTVVLRHGPTRSPRGNDTFRAERPPAGACRSAQLPSGESAFATRNDTAHDVEMYPAPGCAGKPFVLRPTHEQYGPVRSFRIIGPASAPSAGSPW